MIVSVDGEEIKDAEVLITLAERSRFAAVSNRSLCSSAFLNWERSADG